MNWQHIVTRETDLLERYLRVEGYAEPFGEPSSTSVDDLLAVSRDGLTSQYIVPAETEQRRDNIEEEYEQYGMETLKEAWDNVRNRLSALKETVLTTRDADDFRAFADVYRRSRAVILYVFDLGEVIADTADDATIEMLGTYYDDTERLSSKCWDELDSYFTAIAEEHDLHVEDVMQYTPFEFISLIRGGETVPRKRLETRKELYVLRLRDGDMTLHTGNEARDVVDEAGIDEQELESDSVEGTPTFEGQVSGTVSIVNTETEMQTMSEGDILVSSMTTPRLMPAVQRAKGIITDEGGTLCHAAIVSRELEIPCIVGTEHATTVFSDGDEIRLDATNGEAWEL